MRIQKYCVCIVVETIESSSHLFAKVLLTRNFFVPKYLAYHTVQTNSDRGKISKNLKLGFFGPFKCSYFVLKVSRGLVTNELAFRDVEHYENWQRRFLAFGVQVEIRAKNSRYSIFTLLHLCFVFYGEIYIKNGLGKISAQPHTIVKQIWLPSGNVLFLLLFSLSKNWMHNASFLSIEIAKTEAIVVIVEPVKPNRKWMSLWSSHSRASGKWWLVGWIFGNLG